MSATVCSSSGIFTATAKASTPAVKAPGTISSPSCPHFLRPNFGSKVVPKSSRLKISHTARKTSKNVFPVMLSCLVDDNSDGFPEASQSSASNNSNPGATIDIKLPRRSLLVHFTCNACGERSQKLINRLAYEKGTIFIQCSGCSQYHKLVDNLSLVIEYDFREDINLNSDADQP